MKNISQYFLIGTLLLSGCESGLNAGIEGTGDQVGLASSYGTVSGFGSIYVNGVHFDTDTADVEISGAPATEEALAVGMVVEVSGKIAADGKTGVAKTIRAERVLLGVIEAVEAVDESRKAIRILGQTVYINEEATIENISFAELTAGIGVSISGFVTAGGTITATYLIKKDLDVTTDSLEVDGYVSAVDAATQTFHLKDLLVQIAGADFIGGTAEKIQPGVRVHVSGTLLAGMSVLQAARVTFASKPAKEDHYFIIEGVVRDLSAATFMVQSTLVDFQLAKIENGPMENLQNGSQVIVFGTLAQGVLTADRIHIKPRNPNRFSGEVGEINVAEGTFKLFNNLFKVTKYTQFKDSSRAMERYFNLERLRIGDDVEVFAVKVEDVWQVTRITRRDHDLGPEEMGHPSLLRGQVTAVDDEEKHFFIDGIEIDASEVPPHEWDELRNGQWQDVAVDGFFTDDGRFKATHLHLHPLPPCSPHECVEGKLPAKPQLKHKGLAGAGP